MTFPGFEHPPAGAYETICATQPLVLMFTHQNDRTYPKYRSYMQIHTIHTAYMQYRLIQVIHTDTYTYIHIHAQTISVMQGFCAAAAAARDSYAQRHLPRSARTGLRMGSPCNLCAWRAHGRGRAAASPLPDACSAHGRAKRGLGMGP